METPKTVPIPSDLLVEGKKVLIGMPWYRSACPLTVFSLLALMDRSRYGITLNFGDAFIAHSRAKIATQFVNSKMEWLFSCDDDMLLPFGSAKWFNEHSGLNLPEKFAGLHTIDRLLAAGKTLVGGTYFGRAKGRPPVFAEGREMNQELLKRGPWDEVRPTKWVGTGCLLIHRSVLLDIEKKFPHLSRENNNGVGQWFTSSEHDLHTAIDEVVAICADAIPLGERVSAKEVSDILTSAKHKAKVHSGLGIGEDVQMAVRAAQSGHISHIDLGLWCGHEGSAVYPIRP